MASRAAKPSSFADTAPTPVSSQPAGGDFASRLEQKRADAAFDQAELARRAGLTRQMVSGYINRRRGPGPEVVFALADALGVNPRWLLLGEGPQLSPDADPQVVLLRHYDLAEFSDDRETVPAEYIPVRREWLGTVKVVQGIWLTEMPSDAFPEIAKAGDAIICRNPEQPLLEGKIYIFRLDGRLIARRVQIQQDGLVLKAGDVAIDPITISAEDLDRLIPIARVLAAFTLNPV